jgi:hypothetical protein
MQQNTPNQSALDGTLEACVSPPLHLLGGEAVDGLGRYLGRSLCLLFFARHGLWVSELKAMLCEPPPTLLPSLRTHFFFFSVITISVASGTFLLISRRCFLVTDSMPFPRFGYNTQHSCSRPP